MRNRIAIIGLLLASILPSQRTVIVDATGAPDADHVDLPPALAALQDGDVILVRPGTYQGASLSTAHSFAIIGDGAPSIVPAGSGNTLHLTLSGNEQQRVSLAGLHVESHSTGQWAVRARSYRGSWPAPTLHLEDCTVRSTSPHNDQLALRVEALGLTAHRCTLDLTQIHDAMAVIVDSTIDGHDASTVGGFRNRPLTALDVINSDAWLVNTTLTAGSSQGLGVSPANCLFFADDTFGAASTVHLCGSTRIVGDAAPGAGWSAPDLVRNYSYWNPQSPTVTHEATVTFVPSPGGAIWSTGLNVATATVPHLDVSTAPLGGTVTCAVHGSQGDLSVALVGLTTAPTALFGTPLLLDITTAVAFGSVTIDASGTASFPLAVPNDPLLTGLPLEFTGAVVDPNTLAVTLTNPGSAIVR